MVENEMRAPVVKWLQSQGMECAHECMFSGYCDVIGFEFASRVGRSIPPLKRVIAVELKMSNVRAVIQQARNNKYVVSASYAAMPSFRCAKMRETTLKKFKAAGVGLLSVNGDEVTTLIEPEWQDAAPALNSPKRWWRWHLRNEK